MTVRIDPQTGKVTEDTPQVGPFFRPSLQELGQPTIDPKTGKVSIAPATGWGEPPPNPLDTLPPLARPYVEPVTKPPAPPLGTRVFDALGRVGRSAYESLTNPEWRQGFTDSLKDQLSGGSPSQHPASTAPQAPPAPRIGPSPPVVPLQPTDAQPTTAGA